MKSYYDRGRKRILAISAINQFFECVEAAARGVWLKKQNGTTLPYIIVAGIVQNGKFRLNIFESRRERSDTWFQKFEEVHVFDGGRPEWRKTAKKWRKETPAVFRNKTLREVWTQKLSTLSSDEYLPISNEIQASLNAKDDNWFDRIGGDVEWEPEELLVNYLYRNEIHPASQLAHTILAVLAREPIRNARKIFEIFDYLNKHQDKDKFQNLILGVLRMMSRATNEHATRQYKRLGRIGKSVVEIHKVLLKRPGCKNYPGSRIFPEAFVHVPDVNSTCYLL